MPPVLHPLEQKIVTLRRRVRRRAVLYGLSVFAATVLGTMAVLGLIDYLLRLQDRGLRIIASLVLLGVLGWTLYRYLWTALFVRLRNADLALRVQLRFPALDDRLASAIEFLRLADDDPAAGSVALRRAVVAEATAESERLDFADVLDPRPAARAGILLAAACLLVGLLITLNPLASRIAAARLANPLGDTAWPKVTHLASRQPVERVARGQAFQVEVVDLRGAPLPAEVRIRYRFQGPDEGTVEESERMRLVNGMMTARREKVLRPFSYRLEGGDDQTPWFDVAVDEPPAIETLTVRLIPPVYTGWPATSGERQIRALAGTRVELAGTATKPLRAATLCIEGGETTAVQIGQDGYAFTAAFVVENSGSYWLDLIDRDGLRGGSDDRWEVRAMPDTPPTVNVEQPTANLFVTPRAVVPIRVSARDDLAIHRISLVFRQSDSEPETSMPLWTAAERPHPSALAEGARTTEGDRRVVDYPWDLGPLKLKAGTQLTFYAAASDYRPQTGKSEPLRLSVITPEEMQERIAGREKLVLAELERALKMQRACRSQVAAITTRVAELPSLAQTDVDGLRAAQNSQHDASRVLAGRSEGVPMHVLALLADLENNRIDGMDLQQRMSALLEEIDRLEREHLPPIEREFTAAVKTAQVSLEGQGRGEVPGKTLAAALASVGQHQDAIVAAIEQLLGQLARWDNYRRFQREIGQLFHDQEELTRRTSEVGRSTLTRQLRDLSPEEAADLKVVGGRQLELARLLDHTLQEMAQAAGAFRQNDPLAAKTVAEALDEARRSAVSGQMRAAGEQIQANQIGQAAATQKQIGENLQEVLDILANRRQQEVARLEDTLRRLRRQQEEALEETKRLDTLEQSQDGLTRALALAVRDLARLQHKLAADTAQLSRRLAGAIAMALARAGVDMGQAGDLLDTRQTGPATQAMERSAMRRLDLLLEALKPEEPTAQSEPLQGEGPRGGQAGQQGAAGSAGPSLAELKLLKLSQQDLNLRTAELQKAIGASVAPTDEQVGQCKQVSEEQGRLADTVLQPLDAEKEADKPLLEIGRQMRHSEQRISHNDAGPETQGLQRQIVANLDRLIQQARQNAKSRSPGENQAQSVAQRTPEGSPPIQEGPAGTQRPGSKPAVAGSKGSSGEEKDRKPDMDAMRAAVKRHWGELPEHARQQMRQWPVEEFPPKYEVLIEEYFRRLSEEKGAR